MADRRRRVGVWAGRFYVSVVIGGYGVSLGFLWKPYKWDDLVPIRPFRNAAYRGLLPTGPAADKGAEDFPA